MQKYLFSFLAIFGVFLSPILSFAEDPKNSQMVTISPSGGSFAVGQEVTITAPEGMRIFWTLHPNRAREAGRVSDLNTTSFYLARSADIAFSAWDTNGNETPLQIVHFEVESPRENEYFRFSAIDPHPLSNFVPTITLENASEFSMSLEGWKVMAGDEEMFLPDEEIEAGEVRRFVFPLPPQTGRVFLVSPKGIKKDEVVYRNLKSSHFLQRLTPSGKRETRPLFEKVRHGGE